jgi:hypothetical protein
MAENVCHYGAKGDGINDDTEAIHTAKNVALAGDTVFFPTGRYRITSPIIIDKPLTLRGEGTDAYYYGFFGDSYYVGVKDAGSVIVSDMNDGAIIDHTTSGYATLRVIDLHLKGEGDDKRKTVGIQIGAIDQGQFATISGVRLSNFKTGIALLNVQNTKIDDVWAFGCSIGADLGPGVCANTFVNFNASGCDYGVLLGGAVNTFIGGAVQSTRKTGFVVSGEENSLRGIYFENPEAEYAIDVLRGADNTVIDSCHYSMTGHDNVRIGSMWCRVFAGKYADTLTILGDRTQVIGPWSGKIIDDPAHATVYLSPLQ